MGFSKHNKQKRKGKRPEAKPGLFSHEALEICGVLIFVVIGAGFHIAGGWCHVVGFSLDFLAVCCGLTIITHHVEAFKLFGFKFWLSVFLAFSTLATLTSYVVKKETANPLSTTSHELSPISIRYLARVDGPPGGGLIAALCPIQGGKFILSPVPNVMYVELTNLKDTSLTIDSYSLEGKIDSGEWVQVKTVNPEDAQLFLVGAGLKNAARVDCNSDAFDNAIRKEIVPSGSARGWIFSTLPKNENSDFWRLTVFDSAGQKYVQPIEAWTNAGQDEIHRADFNLGGSSTADLSGYPRALIQ
jgi:hypothetical protein